MMPVAPRASSWTRRSRNSSRVPVKVICLAADTSTSASWPFENVEGMTAVNGEVADVLVHTFDAGQPRFAVRQRFHAFRIGRLPEVIGERDERFDGARGARRGDFLSIIEDRAVGLYEASLELSGRRAERNQAVGDLFGERVGLWSL